jgi:protein-L-isoaspartate O-methyltransferase
MGARLVAPIGDDLQELVVITRAPSGFEQRSEGGVRFVPMTGEAQVQR